MMKTLTQVVFVACTTTLVACNHGASQKSQVNSTSAAEKSVQSIGEKCKSLKPTQPGSAEVLGNTDQFGSQDTTRLDVVLKDDINLIATSAYTGYPYGDTVYAGINLKTDEVQYYSAYNSPAEDRQWFADDGVTSKYSDVLDSVKRNLVVLETATEGKEAVSSSLKYVDCMINAVPKRD